jgi:hypothetical protein
MLKKRIVVSAIILCLFTLFSPCLSQAMPLSWLPGPDAIAKLAQGWDLLTGLRHAPAARPAGRQGLQVKNGCGIDPQGQPLCGPGPGTSGATAPADGDPGSGS